MTFDQILSDITRLIKKNKNIHILVSYTWFNFWRALRFIKVLCTQFNRIASDIRKFDQETLVIEVPYGGLGDHLFFSHIPRIAKITGKYNSVYISTLSPIRQVEHLAVIWKLNPFVDGFTALPGRIFKSSQLTDGNILDEIMLFYGVDDGVRYHEPELFYKPKINQLYADKILFDPNFVTKLNGIQEINEISRYFKKKGIKVDQQFLPRGNCNPLQGVESYIEDESFEEFCDIISSADHIYCYATGTAVLAAALGKSANVFFHDNIDQKFIFSGRNNYINLQACEND